MKIAGHTYAAVYYSTLEFTIVTSTNEFKTKVIKIYNKEKIEPQHIYTRDY